MGRVKKKTLAKSKPYGIAAVAQGALAVGKALAPVAKAIYKHPKVQSKWKEFKKKHGLEWLPFGPNHPMIKNGITKAHFDTLTHAQRVAILGNKKKK